MIPATISVGFPRIRAEISSTNPMDRSAPKKAALIMEMLPGIPVLIAKTISRTATHSFAPEEMPSTNGPAIGFRKKVCRR